MEFQSTTGSTAGASSSTTTFVSGATASTAGQTAELASLVLTIDTPVDGQVIPDALNTPEDIFFSGTVVTDATEAVDLVEVSLNGGVSWLAATTTDTSAAGETSLDWEHTFSDVIGGTYQLLVRAITATQQVTESVTVRVNTRPMVLTSSVSHLDIVAPNEALTIEG